MEFELLTSPVRRQTRCICLLALKLPRGPATLEPWFRHRWWPKRWEAHRCSPHALILRLSPPTPLPRPPLWRSLAVDVPRYTSLPGIRTNSPRLSHKHRNKIKKKKDTPPVSTSSRFLPLPQSRFVSGRARYRPRNLLWGVSEGPKSLNERLKLEKKTKPTNEWYDADSDAGAGIAGGIVYLCVI